MKKNSFLMAIALIMISISAWGQQISLSLHKAPLKKVFKAIEAQTGYNFVYAEDDLKNAMPVTIQVNKGKLQDILETIFDNQPLTYTISSNTIVVKEKPKGLIDKLRSFFKSLTGRVTDEKGVSLLGVTVSVEGGQPKTSTDSDGRFNLYNLPTDAVIAISYVGYKTRFIAAAALTGGGLPIQLEPGVNELEEVVMVGYGSSKRKDLTGAVSSVEMGNLRNTAFTTIDQALSGQASGVQVVQSDGSPAGLAKIRIRGGESLIGGNDPLYVIDGVQVTVENRYIQTAADLVNPVENLSSDPSATTSIGSSFARGLNTLAGLNINDIASIDILKDASATAIYGSKAANGVIIITTKRGLKNQKSTVEASYLQTYSTPITVKVLNASQYESILKEGAANLNKQTAPYTYSSADSILNDPSYFQTSTNWIGLVTRTGVTQNADVSIHGGGPDSRYYTSLSYTNQTGTVLGTDFNRIAGKVNLENDITDRLHFATNLDYGFTKNDISNGVYTSAVLAPPNLQPFSPDGSPKQFLPEYLGGRVAEGDQNPFSLLEGENHANTAVLLGSVSLAYDILKSLKFESIFSLNYTSYHQQNYVPATVYIYTDDPSSTGGFSTQGQTQQTAVFFENTLTWNKQFNTFNRLTLLGGTSWQQTKTNTFSFSTAGYPDADLVTDATSPAIVDTQPTTFDEQSALLSFYLRANYACREKYLLTITGRSDASSKFPVDHRVGYFPSAGMAWLANKEGFLKNVSWLNELKFRVSAGLTGTQNISDNLFYTLYTPASYAGSSAMVASTLGSNGTKWETTLQKDAGIEFALFNSRLRGSIGYYEKKSSDLLVALPVPTSTGFSNALQNYATIDNRGMELELRGDIIYARDFQWTTSLNISGNRSRVLKLNETLSDPFTGPVSTNAQLNSFYLGNTVLTVGQPVGLIYGTKYLGIVKPASQSNSPLSHSYPSQAPGSPIYQLIQSGPYAGEPEHMVIGHAEPKFFGGFTSTFTYKRFSLTTLFSFSYGGDIIDLLRGNDMGLPDQSNHTTGILDHYNASNTASNNPGLIFLESGNNSGLSSFDVFSASYIKLKSLTLNYQLPQKLTDKLHVHEANIFFAGNNLFIISNYPGPDPEVSNDPYSLIGGYTDDASYPTARQYSFGLRMKL